MNRKRYSGNPLSVRLIETVEFGTKDSARALEITSLNLNLWLKRIGGIPSSTEVFYKRQNRRCLTWILANHVLQSYHRVYGVLSKCRSQLEDKIGDKLIVQEKWGSRWARFYFERREGSMTEELKKWAVDTMIQLYDIVLPFLKS